MFGHFTNLSSWCEIIDLYRFTNSESPPNLASRRTVAQAQDVPIVKVGREFSVVRRGTDPIPARDARRSATER